MFVPPLIRKIEPGDVIGRCRAIRELGRGGVGTVYLATHQTLQIEVALKVLSPSLSLENPALAERFIREAQLAARIRHPNVIAVMDAAQDETTGLYFIVMEYVGGGSLSWHLRHGPLPEAKALSIVTGIAHALAIAEENQIVHRDIKPDNIILDLRGTAKLADLGLAKQALDTQASITLGGSFMGTPAYMSPDQARDAKIADTRDDIYSLGASFYECLTGLPPFQGETPYNIMSELLTKPSPEPRALRPELSLSTDLICRKMMCKNRAMRYADARALLKDLQHAQAYGDAGLDRLEAASMDRESVNEHQQAVSYGVQTSSDGVYAMPDFLDDAKANRLARPTSSFSNAPPKTDSAVFGAAVLLIALVTVAALVLAWAGPSHPMKLLAKEYIDLTGQAPVVAAKVPKEKTKTHPHTVASHEAPAQPSTDREPAATPTQVPPVDTAPALTTTAPSTLTAPDLAMNPPVVPPASPADLSNAAPAVPVNPGTETPPVPATAVAPDTAFIARSVAENSLDAGNIGPTGQAELLKIVGRRDETQVTPSTWTFYFYEKAAQGHARIVTVTNGKVAKTGEDLIDFASPYSEQSVLPEDKLQIDSSQALAIAEAQTPGVEITGSEFSLEQQKDSVPMWKLTLWTKGEDGGRRLGEVTILAENGTVIRKNLKP